MFNKAVSNISVDNSGVSLQLCVIFATNEVKECH